MGGWIRQLGGRRSANASKAPSTQISVWSATRLVAPATLAVASTLLALALTLLPEAAYRRAIDEPYYFFHDYRAIAYILVCSAAFLSGTLLASLAFRRGHTGRVGVTGDAVVASTMAVMAAVGLVMLWAGAVILGDVPAPALLRAFVSAPTTLRSTLSDLLNRANVGSVVAVAHAVVIWGFWLFLVARGKLERRFWQTYVLALTGFTIATLALTAASLSRGLIISLFVEAFVVWVLAISGASHSVRKAIRVGILVAAVAIGLFAVSQLIRNSSKTYLHLGSRASLTYSLAGYYPASFNRLSAMLAGDLSLPLSGHPTYTTQWYWNTPVFSTIIAAVLGVKSIGALVFGQVPPSNWGATYSYVSSAGLNPDFNVVSAFGYVFHDYGWFGWVFFLAYGLLSGYIWRQFLARTVVGIILYPAIAWSILEWRGYLEIARPSFLLLLLGALLILFARIVVRGAFRGSSGSK